MTSPSITNELRESIISYLSNGVVGFLIYMPSLGMGNPNQEEYAERVSLTMSRAVEHEIGGLSLHGYQRCLASISREGNDSLTTIRYGVSFSAYEGSMSAFTHVCLSRGSIFIDDPITGNGRGRQDGTLIYSAPVGNEALILDAGESYQATLSLNITNYIL